MLAGLAHLLNWMEASSFWFWILQPLSNFCCFPYASCPVGSPSQLNGGVLFRLPIHPGLCFPLTSPSTSILLLQYCSSRISFTMLLKLHKELFLSAEIGRPLPLLDAPILSDPSPPFWQKYKNCPDITITKQKSEKVKVLRLPAPPKKSLSTGSRHLAALLILWHCW